MIELEDLPLLNDPIVIAAFEGWNDAGDAASAAVLHLASQWDAELVAAVDPADYYDFQVFRPRVLGEHDRRRVEWQTTRVYLATDTSLGRDVLLVHGVEPSFRWPQFCSELLGFVQEVDASLFITLGAFMGEVAHTRPLPVTITSDDEPTRRRLSVQPPSYEGPVGIVGVLTDAAAKVGIATLSAWVAVPAYAAGSPSPKGSLALLGALEDTLDGVLDPGDLPDQSHAWELGVDELADADDEVASWVRQIEQTQDTADLPEASGDAIAREFQKFLRRRDDRD